MDLQDFTLLNTTARNAAVQITRPKSASSASNQGILSSINQIKVAKLVLKEIKTTTTTALPTTTNRLQRKNGEPPTTTTIITSHSPRKNITTLNSFKEVNINDNNDDNERLPAARKQPMSFELGKSRTPKSKDEEKLHWNKSAVQQKAVEQVKESNSENLQRIMDIEAGRQAARNFMKHQKEKRKIENKIKDVDQSSIIKKRLEDLKKNTKQAINNKPRKPIVPEGLSIREQYSLNNFNIREIKVLKLKKDVNSKPEPVANKKVSENDVKVLKLNQPDSLKDFDFGKIGILRKLDNDEQHRVFYSPLKIQNRSITQNTSSPASAIKASSLKENKNPEDDLKLIVPDVKLTLSNRTDHSATSVQQNTTQNKPQPVPFWLRNTIRPCPYNFIMAVRKKLESVTTEQSRIDDYNSTRKNKKAETFSNFQTPQSHFSNNVKKMELKTKFPDFMTKNFMEESLILQRPTINDDSDTNVNNTSIVDLEPISEANTISEISSIKSDIVTGKSLSNHDIEHHHNSDRKGSSNDSILMNLEPNYIKKTRERFSSTFDGTSFDQNNVNQKISPNQLSPNTSEKRNNFLSSTKMEVKKLQKISEVPERKDKIELDKNEEKDQEYKKMLLAFNKSLSHVMEVNQMLSSVLTNRLSKTSSTVVSSKTQSIPSNSIIATEESDKILMNSSSQKKSTNDDYSSTFEKNLETEMDQKTTVDSNISEMIENLVQSSAPQRMDHVEYVNVSRSSSGTLLNETVELEDETSIIKRNLDKTIISKEQHNDFSATTTRFTTTTTTTEILHKNISHNESEIAVKDFNEDQENTINESKLLDMFKYSESEMSLNGTVVEKNCSFASIRTIDQTATTQIQTWERALIERTRGQIAWLELQKQNFRKHGNLEKVSTIKKQQRAIIMKLEKERAVSQSRLIVQSNNSMTIEGNGSNAREAIEKILQDRENKIVNRRKHIEHLMKWQKKLDGEEQQLRNMEKELLGYNKKLNAEKINDHVDEIMNTSVQKIQSIDKSLKILQSIPSIDPNVPNNDEVVDVLGSKLNRLWHRLTGNAEEKYQPTDIHQLNKANLAKFYEDAKEFVLKSNLQILLDTTNNLIVESEVNDVVGENEEFSKSDVSTMNSIAQIETEENSFEEESLTQVTKETEKEDNDEELQAILANQMKVFVDFKKIDEETVKEIEKKDNLHVVDNTTFHLSKRDKSEDELDSSRHSTLGVEDMDIEKDSLINTEPISYASTTIDEMIPEINEEHNPQVTDIDWQDTTDQLLEDTSFPNFDNSIEEQSFSQHEAEDGNRMHDLSTITECTENDSKEDYSSDEISSEIVSYRDSNSERQTSEIEKRLISINDSLEGVNDVFNRLPLKSNSRTETPAEIPSGSNTLTYSTDKNFKASSGISEIITESGSHSSGSNSTNEVIQDLLMLSFSESQPTTSSTPKLLMPDIISGAEQNLKF